VARCSRLARLVPVVFSLVAAISCSRDTAAPQPAASGPVRGGALTVSIRSEPGTFNRFSPRGGNQGPVDALTRVMHATLVHVNRVTGDVEPWLAEKWTASDDGRSYTLTLRDGVTFSDGKPFTSADVAFTFQALYDPAVDSPVASAVKVEGKPLQIATPDPRTVVITMPAPFAPGIALLDNVPILPKHQLQAALDAHTFAEAWGTKTPPAEIAGLGPFTMAEYVPAQRITFVRNPRYFRKDASGGALPYLDRLVLEFIAGGQDPEILRLESGAVDFMSQADIRPEDIAALRRLQGQGALQLAEVGVSIDPNCLWFNLTPGAAAGKAKPYLLRPEFRRAISLAVDRAAIASTVYLGAAAPAYGPITPGNKTWYAASPRTEVHDPAQAKTLLNGLGLTDRNGDGMLDDWKGQPVKFSILVQRGTIRERTVTMVQEQLRQVGIGVDVVGMDVPSMFGRFGAGDYESIYHGFQASAFDPGMNLDFWLSGGSAHVWNTGAPAPWEQALDMVMKKQAAAGTLAERQQLLREAERIFAENLPQIYFVAPKVTVAMSRKVGGAVPVLLDPKILWNADALFVKP
jgi:peptide/nickel transport system substrate-binding protein